MTAGMGNTIKEISEEIETAREDKETKRAIRDGIDVKGV